MSLRGLLRVTAALTLTAVLGALFVSVPERAEALSGSEFNAGYIISDSQFYARDSLSQAQIQDFLSAQIGTCANSLCLSILKVDTPTTTLSFGTCDTYIGEAGESAARIIYKVQQACAISAKVILTTLQKEQGLVTSKAPTSAVLRKAMGQGCPDTAQCDSAFYGFFNQVLTGARQLAWYGNPDGSHTSIKVGQLNAVRYSPIASCGSSDVLIANRATASLYYYTPYQPNAAALANQGGIGDGCSSYGNRNFWVYYNNYFGSPTQAVDPLASLDRAELVTTSTSSALELSGWAMDRADRSKSIEVSVYVDKPNGTTAGYALQANRARPDVGAAYGSGDLHGFVASIPVTQAGTYRVCVFPLTIGGSDLLGCRTLIAVGAEPIGSLDGVSVEQEGGKASLSLSGWSLDRNHLSVGTETHVYVDRPNGTSFGTALIANGNRPDIATAFPGAGSAHGFQTSIPISARGTYRACAYSVVNSPFGQTSESLGCKSVTAGASAPTGSLDGVSIKTTSDGSAAIEVGGWTFDQALPTSQIPVHIYVDRPDGSSSGIPVIAENARTDIGRIFPAAGSSHGFQASIPVEARGLYRVCAFGIGSSIFGAANALLGCRNLTTSVAPTFGALDSVSVVGTGAERELVASGWAADPAAPTSTISVDIYIDRPTGQTSGTRVSADAARPDVASAYGGYGKSHGFRASVPALEAGSYRACAFAISGSKFGSNSLLGCSTVVIGG